MSGPGDLALQCLGWLLFHGVCWLPGYLVLALRYPPSQIDPESRVPYYWSAAIWFMIACFWYAAT